MSAVPGWERGPDDIVVELEMIRTNWSGPFLLLEGPSDECFFGPRVSGIHILQCSGKQNVERALELVEADPTHTHTVALGIVDEDYDWFTGHVVAAANIVKFDPRDLEGFLIRSNALDSVLAEFSSRQTIENFERLEGRSVREAILERAVLFGRLRMFNDVNNRVCLKKFKPVQFCDVATWRYDEARVLSSAVALGVHTNVDGLRNGLDQIVAPSIWSIVRGHDLVDILVGGLLGVLRAGVPIKHPDVERVLRQSVQKSELSETPFFGRIHAWQTGRGISFI